MRSYGIEQAKKNNASLMFNFPNNQSLKTNINYGYQYINETVEVAMRGKFMVFKEK